MNKTSEYSPSIHAIHKCVCVYAAHEMECLKTHMRQRQHEFLHKTFSFFLIFIFNSYFFWLFAKNNRE